MDARGLAGLLSQVLPAGGVITDPTQLRTYSCDGLAHYKVIPALVVLPETAQQVAAVVRACAEHSIPFVARGSGTGLSGGALPHADGVLIVLSRMRAVLDIDRANQRAVVGDERYDAGRYTDARELFEQVALADDFVEFLTLPAYERMA